MALWLVLLLFILKAALQVKLGCPCHTYRSQAQATTYGFFTNLWAQGPRSGRPGQDRALWVIKGKKEIYLPEHNFYGKGNCFNLSASYTVTICKGKVKATQFSMRLLKTNRLCVPASPYICRINRLVFIKRRRFKRLVNILLQNNCPSNLLTITYLLHVNWLNNIWVYKTISVEF